MAVDPYQIPSISDTTVKAFPESRIFYPLKDKIDSFKKNCILYVYIKDNPIKSKVISILDAGLIISAFTIGGLSAFLAATLLSGLIAIGVICGIILVTGLLAIAMGFYFTYRWHGPIPNDVATPILMLVTGIFIPIHNSFTNGVERDCKKDYEEISSYKDSIKTYLETLESESSTDEIAIAKKELEAVYNFFWPSNNSLII